LTVAGAGGTIDYGCVAPATTVTNTEGQIMAKALLGHMGGADAALHLEIHRLRRRVSDLEAALIRAQSENDRLAASLHHDELLTIEDRESVFS
jgi:hypothetical protein